MAVEWSIESLGDLDRIWEFNASHDVDRADLIDLDLQARALKLSAMPHIGRPGKSGTREYSMPDIQYVLAYSVESSGITILSVRSTRERT